MHIHACPCGYYRDPVKPCTCSNAIVTKHQKRIIGPQMDRIDSHIEVPRLEYDKLGDRRQGEPSSVIQARVKSASAYHRVLKLARTIADLAGSGSIQTAHLAEALQYRPRLMEGG